MRKLWINAKPVDGLGDPRVSINPATEEPIGEVAWGTAADAEAAIGAAKEAFHQLEARTGFRTRRDAARGSPAFKA